jgi:hypothetical protein
VLVLVQSQSRRASDDLSEALSVHITVEGSLDMLHRGKRSGQQAFILKCTAQPGSRYCTYNSHTTTATASTSATGTTSDASADNSTAAAAVQWTCVRTTRELTFLSPVAQLLRCTAAAAAAAATSSRSGGIESSSSDAAALQGTAAAALSASSVPPHLKQEDRAARTVGRCVSELRHALTAAIAATTTDATGATADADAATAAALAPLYHTALRAQLDLVSLVTARNELDNYLLHGQRAADLGVALPVVQPSGITSSSAVHSGGVRNSIVRRRGTRRDSAAIGTTAAGDVSPPLSPVPSSAASSSSAAVSAISSAAAAATAAGAAALSVAGSLTPTRSNKRQSSFGLNTATASVHQSRSSSDSSGLVLQAAAARLLCSTRWREEWVGITSVSDGSSGGSIRSALKDFIYTCITTQYDIERNSSQ